MEISKESVQEIDDEIRQTDQAMQSFIGMEGSCKYSINNLHTYLTKVRDGTFEGSVSCRIDLATEKTDCTYTGDMLLAEDCRGDYFTGFSS